MKLKKWVENLLMIINFIIILTLASDCQDMKIFVISKIVGLLFLTINTFILKKYSNVFEV